MPRRWKVALLLFLILATGSFVPLLLMNGMCIFGYGFESVGSEVFILLPIFGLPVGVLALGCLPFRRLRRGAGPVAAVALSLFVLFVPVAKVSAALRRHGFQLAAQRAEPLVAAIERYRRERGEPPRELSALVPDFLPAMPAQLPPLQIVTGDEAQRVYGGNEWALSSEVSIGILNWDMWLYFPNGAYPRHGFGGWLERIDGWAYVHE